IHIMHDPLLAVFLFCAAQFHVAVGVVFKLVAATDELLGGVDAGNADVLFVPWFTPGLRREAPADHKECGFYPVMIEDVDQAWAGMSAPAAEQNVRSGTVVKSKSDEFVRRGIGGAVRCAFPRGRGAGKRDSSGVLLGSYADRVPAGTSAEHAETCN